MVSFDSMTIIVWGVDDRRQTTDDINAKYELEFQNWNADYTLIKIMRWQKEKMSKQCALVEFNRSLKL